MRICDICKTRPAKHEIAAVFMLCDQCHAIGYLGQNKICEILKLNNGTVHKYTKMEDYTVVPPHDHIMGSNQKVWLRSTIEEFMVPIHEMSKKKWRIENLTKEGMKRFDMAKEFGVSQVYIDSFCKAEGIYSVNVTKKTKNEETGYLKFENAMNLFNSCMH